MTLLNALKHLTGTFQTFHKDSEQRTGAKMQLIEGWEQNLVVKSYTWYHILNLRLICHCNVHEHKENPSFIEPIVAALMGNL